MSSSKHERLYDVRRTDRERYGSPPVATGGRARSPRVGPTFSVANAPFRFTPRDVNQTRQAQVRLKLRSHEVNVRDGKTHQRHEFEITHMKMGNPTMRRFRG